MKRSDFIRGISLASLGAVLPGTHVKAVTDELAARTASCVLTSSDTNSARPSDTITNSTVLRQDIRETKTGVQLNLKLKITNTDGEPIPNAWVKIWHSDKNGHSRHNNPGFPGMRNSTGQAFLRGVQISNANGEVEFITVFPGWYSKKVTHIYFRIYLNSVLAATSQLTFPEKAKNIVYTSGSLSATHGGDPRSLTPDNSCSGAYSLQMATITPNVSTGGYDSSLQVTINESTGPAQPEPENRGQFQLLQNYPNPYTHETRIPFTLTQASDVEMEIYDLSGRKVAGIKLDELSAGDHHLPLRLSNLGIVPGTYIYQIVVANDNGVFRQCKVMTGGK